MAGSSYNGVDPFSSSIQNPVDSVPPQANNGIVPPLVPGATRGTNAGAH